MRHSDGKKHVRSPKCKRLNPSYTTAAFKHGGGKGVMVWGCVSGISSLGPLFQINGIMDRFVYRDISERQMVRFADDNMPLMGNSSRTMTLNIHLNLLKPGLILTKSVYRNGQLTHRTSTPLKTFGSN